MSKLQKGIYPKSFELLSRTKILHDKLIDFMQNKQQLQLVIYYYDIIFSTIHQTKINQYSTNISQLLAQYDNSLYSLVDNLFNKVHIILINNNIRFDIIELNKYIQKITHQTFQIYL